MAGVDLIFSFSDLENALEEIVENSLEHVLVRNVPGIPKSAVQIHELQHGSYVTQVAMSQNNKHAFTAGREIVKIWDISQPQPLEAVSSLKCCQENHNINKFKSYNHGFNLIVGASFDPIAIWDLAAESKYILDWDTGCYDLAISNDERLCFSCSDDGKIYVWDIHNKMIVACLSHPGNSAVRIDSPNDPTKLWAGCRENVANLWDLRTRAVFDRKYLESKTSSIACSPTNNLVVIGLGNEEVKMFRAKSSESMHLVTHKHYSSSQVFSHSGKWFVSSGISGALITSTDGSNLSKFIPDCYSRIACDISSDDKHIIFGHTYKNVTIFKIEC